MTSFEHHQYEKDYFLIYTTANEADYLIDFANLSLMAKCHPGVNKIRLFIVTSEVNPFGKKDRIALKVFKEVIEQCSWLDLEEVVFKSNIGRDFSSAQIGIGKVIKLATDDDEVMIRNRSAYGPFVEGWFVKYSNLLQSQKRVGLVGNTINMSGHPHSAYDENEVLTHVQTYVYLSRVSVLKEIQNDFPGINETNRIDLINNGELRLSKLIMARGYLISCLLWPENHFGKGIDSSSELPKKDMKKVVLGLPFEHRKSGIKYPDFKLRIEWRFRKMIAFVSKLFAINF